MALVINPDDLLTVFYKTLAADATFMVMVESVDKGRKRRNEAKNPSCTIHILSAPVDPAAVIQRFTVLVNAYVDDLWNGVADNKTLGKLAQRIAELFHYQDLVEPGLFFYDTWVEEPLILPSDKKGEHLASVRIHSICRTD